MTDPMSYKQAGVDITAADAAKSEMARFVDSGDPRVLNRLGAFASLVDGRFAGYDEPVLVIKTEEPGSKQKLALAHGRATSLCYDLINHLINDIIVLGAQPVVVQDCIICGRLEREVVTELVAGMAAACREQGCTLVGGETSEQPGVLAPGAYVLSAFVVGVVEKARIVDGSRIRTGDTVLAVASNGLHTNGYSLVRALLERDPALADADVGGERFLDVVLRPHKCYRGPFRGLFDADLVSGAAHITGGGVAGNLGRILPAGLQAVVDLSAFRVPPVFRAIRDAGGVTDDDMLRTFNMGVGMTVVASEAAAERICGHLAAEGCEAWPIGRVAAGCGGGVVYDGRLRWP